MAEQKKNNWVGMGIIAILIVLVIWIIMRPSRPAPTIKPAPGISVSNNQTKDTNEPAKPQSEQTKIQGPKLSSQLSEIIKNAAAFKSWYGKTAPDFTLTDITGKEHKLSAYRGKNVMLVFWATWCPPCKMEVPHIIALRNIIPEDKLAILAISYIEPNNTIEMIKAFVAANNRFNYTVIAADGKKMPDPYNKIESIPCSFFIDPQGKIKLATEGALNIGVMRAIIQAEN